MYIITNVYGVLVFANYEMKKSANQIQCIWICTFFSFAFRHNNRTMLIHSGMVFATIYTAIKAILTTCDGLYDRRHNTRMSSHITCLFKIQIHSIPSAFFIDHFWRIGECEWCEIAEAKNNRLHYWKYSVKSHLCTNEQAKWNAHIRIWFDDGLCAFGPLLLRFSHIFLLYC